jgi:ADP-heptose:LPS heptosyltransferase
MTFNRGTEETWYLNPARRYVFNARHVEKISSYVETLSELSGSPHYRPLMAGHRINGCRIFVERFRDRGIGDLLFLTGPFAFMHHVTGNDVRINVYAFADRGAVLQNSPYLEHGTVFVGPTHYNDFQDYHFQWLVNTVTESSMETDQLNVYDALYTQIGIKPEQVDPKFKRPHVQISQEELAGLYEFYHSVWSERQFDLRHTGYYVLAPLTHSSLRTAPYRMWLDLAKELARRRPVFFIGQTSMALPDLDITAGEFVTKSQECGLQVISLLGKQLNLRSVMALISQATALVGLDSGPLYVAQGCRVPAVSLWGPHDPGVRIGYDPDYMDLAVWNEQFCHNSPCFAYGGFPATKCPNALAQKICQPLLGTSVTDVLKKVDMIESKRVNTWIHGLKHESTGTAEHTAA